MHSKEDIQKAATFLSQARKELLDFVKAKNPAQTTEDFITKAQHDLSLSTEHSKADIAKGMAFLEKAKKQVQVRSKTGKMFTQMREEAKPKDTTSKEQSRPEWEGYITSTLERLTGATTSDAQGMLDANSFVVTQSWGKGLSAGETAKLIAQEAKPKETKTNKVKENRKSAPDKMVYDTFMGWGKEYSKGFIEDYVIEKIEFNAKKKGLSKDEHNRLVSAQLAFDALGLSPEFLATQKKVSANYKKTGKVEMPAEVSQPTATLTKKETPTKTSATENKAKQPQAQHGFDKAGFGTVEKFKQVLKDHGLTEHKEYGNKRDAANKKLQRENSTNIWSNKDGSLKLITLGNPEKKQGYAHYIGIEGNKDLSDKLFKDIKNIKDYEAADEGESHYINSNAETRPEDFEILSPEAKPKEPTIETKVNRHYRVKPEILEKLKKNDTEASI